jgi:CII-binding regulator of phage lambda lysogenization HflD
MPAIARRVSLLVIALALLDAALSHRALHAQQPTVSQQPDTASKLPQLQQRFAAQEAEHAQEIKQLTDRVNALNAAVPQTATGVAQLKDALKATTDRLNALETLNKAEYSHAFDAAALRYETGKEVLYVLLKNTAKLDFTISLSRNLASFEALGNPMQSPAFQNVMNDLEQPNHTVDKANLALPQAFLANPFLGAAYAMSSLFTSRFNRQEKEQRFSQIACVLDFTSRVNGDFKVVRANLDQLDTRLARFDTATTQVFEDYMGVVGYRQSWAQYRAARASSAVDPASAAISAYFARLLRDSTKVAQSGRTPNLAPTTYQLQRVRQQLTDYDLLLDQMASFLASYEEILSSHRNESCAEIPNLTSTMQQLIQGAEENRQKFSAAYLDDIPATSKSILLGS